MSTLHPSMMTLNVVQQPQQALVATHKSKSRKPIDPPVVIQLHVANDTGQLWMSNPFVFALCRLVGADGSELGPGSASTLIGAQTSSLCRLKDHQNQDGGFFIFGDLTATASGKYKLRFSIFEFQRNGCQLLKETESNVFEVMSAKKFPGMQESTVLSRIFSDQGVRLRLRKETKGGKEKRRAQGQDDESSRRPEQSQPEHASPSHKRIRYEVEQPQNVAPESSNARMPTAMPRAYPMPTTQYSHQVQTTFSGSSYPSSMNMAYQFRGNPMEAQAYQTPYTMHMANNLPNFHQQAIENGLPAFEDFGHGGGPPGLPPGIPPDLPFQ